MPKIKLWAMMLAVGLLLVVPWTGTAAPDVPRLDKETLKTWLGHHEVLILDVRQPHDWDASDKKIKGAVRQDPKEEVKTWGPGLYKKKKIILYCT